VPSSSAHAGARDNLGGQRASERTTHTQSAHAAPDTVLVVTAGEDSDRVILLANANSALADANVQTADMEIAELNGFDINGTIVCLEQGEECRTLVRKAPAKWLLLLRIKRASADQDADHRVISSLFSAEDGTLLQAKQAICQSCSSRERMAKIITKLVADLAQAEFAARATETYITVNADPPHAILSIDGQVVGPCGQAYQVEPGEHRIEVTFEGYHGAKQSVLVAANENKSISITLSLVKADKKEPREGGNLGKIVGYAALGGGALALGGAAVYLFSVDGDQANERGLLRTTKAEGFAAAGASVLLGAGLLYLLLDGEDPKPDKTAFMATPTGDGFSFRLSGHF